MKTLDLTSHRSEAGRIAIGMIVPDARTLAGVGVEPDGRTRGARRAAKSDSANDSGPACRLSIRDSARNTVRHLVRPEARTLRHKWGSTPLTRTEKRSSQKRLTYVQKFNCTLRGYPRAVILLLMNNAIIRGASYISFTGAIVRVTHIFRNTVKFTYAANGRTIKHEWPFEAFLTRYKPL